MRKPRLFIASSAEKLKVADAFNVNLDHDFEATIWKNGTFNLSSVTINAVVEKSSVVDFALFVFAPDDEVLIREQHQNVIRDNVLFELGLFIGAIGLERCFIVKPRGVELRLPTDLLGVTMADYEADRSDGDLESATNTACTLIKNSARKLGLLEHIGSPARERTRVNPQAYDLTGDDLEFLAACAASYTRFPGGLSLLSIEHSLKKSVPEIKNHIAAIKLERLGYVEKRLATDEQDHYDYFSYHITEDGVNALLSRADHWPDPPQRSGGKEAKLADMDDSIPF
ncbi:nucleotide-binding protein [Castellaniella denitrificans]|uniref:Nucleotide-binding protein n=1 Tax=Castellaniella denitrificans TaxID=56119 RepID=A0ABT4M0B4_9BURK|nr:nucleotide-binding protein [Castellaniella denitrificans]MCZ4328514.1 nucleotide-binding protein [Castellaniella denitrificans]